jgi:hypothetical protein
MVSAVDPHGHILGFLDRSRYYFFQVANPLYSRGWVGPVPDPVLVRKTGSAGNGTWTSGSLASRPQRQSPSFAWCSSTACRRMSEWKCEAAFSWPRHYEMKSGQLHSPAALIPGEIALGWASDSAWSMWSREYSLTLPGVELRLLWPNWRGSIFLLFCITGECTNCVDEGVTLAGNRWTMPLLKLGEKRYYLGIFFKVRSPYRTAIPV